MASFSAEVKNELARLPLAGSCCVDAELCALVHLGCAPRSDLAARPAFATKNAAVARRVITLMKSSGIDDTEVATRRYPRLTKNNRYFVWTSSLPSYLSVEPVIPKSFCCRSAFLRGAFLAAGSISRPAAPCHLEFAPTNTALAEVLFSILRKFDLPAGRTTRKGEPVVYMKEGDAIMELLSLMKADRAAEAFEVARNVKDVRNQVNRIVNCETANMNKTVEASARAADSIRTLAERGRLRSLPAALQDAARVRLAHPEASIAEIASLLGVGRSCANHRLRKIIQLAGEGGKNAG